MFAEVQVTENLSLDEMVAVLEVNGINAMLLCIDKKVCTLGAISPSFHVFRSVGTFAFFLGVHARAPCFSTSGHHLDTPVSTSDDVCRASTWR